MFRIKSFKTMIQGRKENKRRQNNAAFITEGKDRNEVMKADTSSAQISGAFVYGPELNPWRNLRVPLATDSKSKMLSNIPAVNVRKRSLLSQH